MALLRESSLKPGTLNFHSETTTKKKLFRMPASPQIFHSQWCSNCNDLPGNIPNMSNPHTKCGYNISCNDFEFSCTFVWLNISSIHNTALRHLVKSKADYPIEFRTNIHLHLAHMFLSYWDISLHCRFDSNKRSIQVLSLKDVTKWV